MKAITGAEKSSGGYSGGAGYRVETPACRRKKPIMRRLIISRTVEAMMIPPGLSRRGKGYMKTINDIPYGHARPLLRPTKSYEDRALRKNIEDANRNGDCIINVGAGYYRPIPGDPVDEKELNEYLAQELHRARAIQSKRLAMKLAFERRREVGVFTGNPGETG